VPVYCGFEPLAAVAGLAPAESCLKDRSLELLRDHGHPPAR
jgi:hypothetical protein